MAFNFFRKKEIIEDNKRNSGDIVEDFGNYIKSNNPSSNDISVTSFDNNFNENIGDNSSIPNIDNVNSKPIITSLETHYNENNDYQNNIIADININNDNSMNAQVDSNNTLQNINNYDYNPIMDNLENVSNNIKNSQDVNVALSNLYKSNPQSETIEQPSIVNESSTANIQSGDTRTSQIEDVDPGYKRCPKCGQKMREDYKQCFVCGAMF